MTEHERRKQELLEELARRFRESARTLKSVARRINDASSMHHDTVRRLNRANHGLRACVESDSATMPFSYLEYIEFSSSEEFRKFRDMEAITQEEIDAINWEKLAEELLADA